MHISKKKLIHMQNQWRPTLTAQRALQEGYRVKAYD